MIAMKREQLEQNIRFVIQPLHFVSRIFALTPFHIDPNYKFRNNGGYTFCHIIHATVVILLLLYGLYKSVLTIFEYNGPKFNGSIRVVWAINTLVSNFAGILALLFSVTKNRNHISTVLCLLSSVDNKLFRNKSKQTAYSKQRLQVKIQCLISLMLFGTVYIPVSYLYSDGTWMRNTHLFTQVFRGAIQTIIILLYINVVLMVKQRYLLVTRVLSEAATTDGVISSRRMNAEHLNSKTNNKTFPMTIHNLKIDTKSNNFYTIRDLRLICGELCDVLHANNKSYELLILFDVIITLTGTVSTTYSGFMTIQSAVVENGHFQLYLQGVLIICQCAFALLTLLWLTMCCQRTTEEIRNIFICIQKLLLYPNELGWCTSELERFSYQIKNSTFEFNICGFFTLNLQFFCASVSVIFTYILVIHQLS
jgi:hypothetical protein